MRWLGVLGVTLGLLLTGGGSARAEPSPGPVVLIGTGSLRWDQVTAAQPTLNTLRENGSSGWMVVRSVRAVTCPVDGWLAISAGSRAADAECGQPQVRVPSEGGPGRVTGWPRYLDQAARDDYDARPGLLGETLAAHGVSTAAVGPGAAVALADADGRVPHVMRDVPAAVATDPDVLVVDLAPEGSTPVAALEKRLSATLNALPTNATVMVASPHDAGTSSRLRLVSVTGGSYGNSLLGSASTRQDALVQTTDLLPTILELAGVPVPVSAVGAPMRPVNAAPRTLADLDAASEAIGPVVVPFFAGLVGTQVLVYGLAWWRGRRVPYRTAIAFACVPAATFLANEIAWWRFPVPSLALCLAVLVWVLPMAVIALAGPWRHTLLGPPGVVAAMSALVLARDALSGSPLALSSLLGLQPVIGGRFHGFGNPAFAVFATAALVSAVALADVLPTRRGRVLAVGAVGIAAVVVDGAPGLGSDFGGPPALVPAFAVLGLLVAGVRVTGRRLLLVGVGTLGLVTVAAGADWMREPGSRTHLGRFAQTVIDGGALPVITRKAELNLHILLTTYLVVLVPAVVVLVAHRLARGHRMLPAGPPALRAGLIAFGVLAVIGSLVNDSGATVATDACLLMAPLMATTHSRMCATSHPDRNPSGTVASSGGR
ncbi:hypothetical protein [Kineosporia succinea]|uniref:Uncharacterized protein n=1 Tax=Kineosporia succinea TaxID=84632 RepID=A0ABT9PEF6_9ACTN|nr:hypothetical protein [Kineosporia succinea]MDP9831100.1 hypothetical protein [Kineosporia succinea]